MASCYLPPLTQQRLVLGLCFSRRQVIASRITTQRNSNILTSALQIQSRQPRKDLQLEFKP